MAKIRFEFFFGFSFLKFFEFFKSVYSILKFATENYIADDYMDECILCPSNSQGFPNSIIGSPSLQISDSLDSPDKVFAIQIH